MLRTSAPTRRRFLNTSLLGAGGLAAGALLPSAVEAADEILLGGVHDESGVIDIAGQPMAKVLRFAVKELNDKGGVLGKPVRLVEYDSQSNMQLYSQYAQQLALRDRVAVVQGGITSASREVIRPVLNRFKTLYFYNTQYEGGVCDRNIFCTGTVPSQTVKNLVEHVTNKWGKKIYSLAADYNYGQITATWVEKYAKDFGGEVVATEFFPLDVTNFGPTISKIQAAKPDLIMSILVGSAHLSFYRQWAAAGMKAQIPMASTTFGAGGNEIVLLTPEESNGMIGSLGYFQEIDTPANNDFRRRIEAFFGADAPLLTELSCATYEGTMLWAKAVEMAGGTDTADVIEALETGISVDGPSGKVTIEPQSHHTTRDVHIAEINDRKWKVLQTFEQQGPGWSQEVCNLKENPRSNKQVVFQL